MFQQTADVIDFADSWNVEANCPPCGDCRRSQEEYALVILTQLSKKPSNSAVYLRTKMVIIHFWSNLDETIFNDFNEQFHIFKILLFCNFSTMFWIALKRSYVFCTWIPNDRKKTRDSKRPALLVAKPKHSHLRVHICINNKISEGHLGNDNKISEGHFWKAKLTKRRDLWVRNGIYL